MSDDVSILIDGNEEADRIHLNSLITVEMAHGGEVGIGGFNLADATLSDTAYHKEIIITDDRATPTQIYSGFIGDEDIDRGREATVGNLREHDVMMLDLNTVLDDEVFRSDNANRPEETDYERVSWLLTTSAIDALDITAGVVPNTNTVNLDAIDYRGQGPRRVLDDCAEASGKNYFIYDHGAGRKLYYDLHTGTSLASSLQLSSVLADVDGVDVLALIEPRERIEVRHIYSTVRFKYDGGSVWVTNTTTEDDFRRREIGIEDLNVKSATKATNKATKYLAAAAEPVTTFGCSVQVPASLVNGIRAGHRIEIKCPHLGFSSFTWFRITRREVVAMPGEGGHSSDEFYLLRLEFAEDFQITGFGGGGGGSETKCDECVRKVVLLPSGMDQDLSMAYGEVPNIYVHDGADLVKYRCNLDLLWQVTATAGIGLIYHEAGTATAVNAGDVAYETEDGDIRFDITDEITGTAANVTDRPTFWIVGTEV